MRDGRDACRVLVEIPERMRSLGRSWRRWKDNIKINLQGVGLGDMDWIDMAREGVGGRLL
jgi:hypothetical protein